MKKLRLLLGILSLGVLMTLGVGKVASAQDGATSASIVGLVKDQQNSVIGGTLVTAKNLATNSLRTTISNEDGSFNITQLQPGTYEIVLSSDGFASRTFQVTLVIGTRSLLNCVLSIESAANVVEITGNSFLQNEGKTESSYNIDQNQITNLPINRRNFLDFTLTTPRVVRDRVPMQGITLTSGLSFNGQSARLNNITIDGVDNNDRGGAVRTTFSQDSIQEFQVISDSSSAEFGRALGGIVNIVTKTGNNNFQGTLFLLNRNDSISARNAFSTINPEFKQYQFGAALSGPIKKDKAFFFTSFERLSIKQNNVVTISQNSVDAVRRQGFNASTGALPFSLGTTTFLARFDIQINPNNNFTARYNLGNTFNGALETFGGLVDMSNSGTQRLNDDTVAASNTYINPGLRLINETRFTYGRLTQDLVALGSGPQLRVIAPEGLLTFGQSSFLPQLGRVNDNFQIVNNVSLERGRNQIKFGVDYEYFDQVGSLLSFNQGFATFTPFDFSALVGIPGSVLNGLQNLDPSLRTPQQRAFLTTLAQRLPAIVPGFPSGVPLADLSIPVNYVQGFGSPVVTINANFFSLFAQNDLKLKPNLLIKTGIRYDLNRVQFMPDNNGNFSPRLAFSYRPGKLEKLNIHGSYGLFFGAPLTTLPFAAQIFGTGLIKLLVLPFPFSVLPFSLPNRRFPVSEEIPNGANFVPQLSQTLLMDKNIRNSYSQQTSVGIDYFIDNNTAISLSYSFVRGIKIIVPRNINPVVRPVVGNPLLSALIGRVDPTQGNINQYQSAFDSYYHGATIAVNRRFSKRFGFFANYTFSKGIDNFIDIRTDLIETANSLRPRDERGLSLQDARHRFVFSGVWELDYTKNAFLRDFKLSTIVNINSGQPYNLLAGVDLNRNGDNPPGDRPLIGGVSIGRNTGVTPGFSNVDLRLERIVKIKETYRIQALIEVFNLFNNVNISDVARIFSPDAQARFNLPARESDGRFGTTPNQFRGAFAPRQFQIGVRLSF